MANQDNNRTQGGNDQNRSSNQGSQQRDQRSSGGGMNQPGQSGQRSGVDQSRKDQDFTANE